MLARWLWQRPSTPRGGGGDLLNALFIHECSVSGAHPSIRFWRCSCSRLPFPDVRARWRVYRQHAARHRATPSSSSLSRYFPVSPVDDSRENVWGIFGTRSFPVVDPLFFFFDAINLFLSSACENLLGNFYTLSMYALWRKLFFYDSSFISSPLFISSPNGQKKSLINFASSSFECWIVFNFRLLRFDAVS